MSSAVIELGLTASYRQSSGLGSVPTGHKAVRQLHLGSHGAPRRRQSQRAVSRSSSSGPRAQAPDATDRSSSQPSGSGERRSDSREVPPLPASPLEDKVKITELATSPEGAIRQDSATNGAASSSYLEATSTNGAALATEAAATNGSSTASSAAARSLKSSTSGTNASTSSIRSTSDSTNWRKPDTPPFVLEYFKACESLEGCDFGPPRFFCPIDARPVAEQAQGLPKLFFVPGIEGTGFGLQLHHKSLGRIFELSCLNVPKSDRTPFFGMVEIVERALQEEHAQNPWRAIFLMGESFGAVVVLAVAERNPNLPLTLVLVNPATSFERSEFQPLVAAIPFIPDALYPLLPAFLSFSMGNPVKMASSGIKLDANPVEKALGIRENLLNMIPILPEVGKLLPKATLEWKMKLLDEGTKYMEPLLPNITFPTLILCSTDDKLIPSEEEAKRLKGLMVNSKVYRRTFSESGHTLLLEGDIDVAAVIKGSGVYRKTSNAKENPYIDSYTAPTAEDMAHVRRAGLDGPIRTLCSPVFLSTLEDGTIVQSLDGIPKSERPLLFVGNHQTYAPDLSILVGEMLEKTGVLMRGLAHPMALGMFQGETADTGMSDTFRLFGAVPVTPTIAYKLMAKGEALLLFPGGAREALRNRGEEYKLFWPEREEFIRLAIRFNATIVPFAAVGVDDGYNFVLDGSEILQNPFLGPRMKEFVEAAPRVRDESAGPAMEQFSPPVVLPKQINRLYFLFQKPVRPAELGVGLKDREATSKLYKEVKQEVEDGISYLLKKREEDPYKDLATRLIYEASWGGKRQAPTFSP